MSVLVPTLLAACTSVEALPSSARAKSVDVEGLWIAREFPCEMGLRDLQLSLKHQKKEWSARVAAESECAKIGWLVWQGVLPAESITSDDLPLTVRVELVLPPPRTAAITLLSIDRMVLLVDDASVTLERGTLHARPDADKPNAAAGAGGRDGGANPPDDAGARTGASGMSGALAAAPSGTGGSGAAGSATPAASGSGGAGMSSSMNSGTGGVAAVDAGSTLDAGQVDAAAGRGADPSAAGGGGAGAAAAGQGAGGAGSDAGSHAAGSGAGGAVAPPDVSGRNWDCLNLAGFCSCIAYPESEGPGGDCNPRLPCCYTDLDDEKPQCICEPEQRGGGCYVFGSDSHRPRVDWCPGQSDP